MKRTRHISWKNFSASILVPGQQRVHRISDRPLVELFGDGIGERIGIWMELGEEAPIPPEIRKLVAITTKVISHKGIPTLEVSTASKPLQRQFFHFALAVAERVLIEKSFPLYAVTLELGCFTELLDSKSILNTERQTGLLGEILLLEKIVAKDGSGAMDAWIGPQGEPHDFRTGTREFEVKTTVTAHRLHTINGSEQLVPSKDCTLFLLSIVLGPAGQSTGFSLPERIDALEATFGADSRRTTQFLAALERCGYRKGDAEHYSRRYVLRRNFALIPVDGDFPALTRPAIQKAIGPLAERIESLSYDVDVEGLGFEETEEQFKQILPLTQ